MTHFYKYVILLMMCCLLGGCGTKKKEFAIVANELVEVIKEREEKREDYSTKEQDAFTEEYLQEYKKKLAPIIAQLKDKHYDGQSQEFYRNAEVLSEGVSLCFIESLQKVAKWKHLDINTRRFMATTAISSMESWLVFAYKQHYAKLAETRNE